MSPPCCIDFGTSVLPIEKAQNTQICSISISDFNLCARILNTYTRVCIIKHIDTCSSKFTTWCEIIKHWKKKHSLLIRFDKCNIRPKKKNNVIHCSDHISLICNVQFLLHKYMFHCFMHEWGFFFSFLCLFLFSSFFLFYIFTYFLNVAPYKVRITLIELNIVVWCFHSTVKMPIPL